MKGIFDRYLQENYKYEIKGATLSKETGVLKLKVAMNFVVPFNELEKVKKELLNEITGILDVRFFFDFKEMVLPREEIIGTFMGYMQSTLSNNPWIKTISTNKPRIDGDTVYIETLGESVAGHLNEDAAEKFSGLIKQAFGYELKFVFENNEDKFKEAKSKVSESLKEAPRPPEFKMSAQKKKSNGKLPANGRLLGREISAEPVEMISVTEATPKIAFEGEVFHIEDRPIKNNKLIVTFYFTDKTSSVCGKFFCGKEKWEAIEDHFKKGITVRASGSLEWDNYSNSLVLMVKDLQRVEVEKRMDKAEEKRIEFHAHTKMSAMDGISNAEDLVNMAKSWGHKAIAITDHGVVQSFPKAYDAAGGDLKLIMGLEGYLLNDDDGNGAEIDYKSKPTNHIILLAKNETGLKNLYKLVSLSHIKYFYKKPRLPKSVINQYREGILIGSACEAGELFRAIVAGEADENLDKIASYYDYLEVQPLVNNSFMLRNGTANTKDDLIAYNKKVIEVGKKIGKPILATCDAHYISKEDVTYRSVLMAGQGYEDYDRDSGLYFRTTEEMMEEFSYLDEETCKEIIVENPQKISDMISDMRPVPLGHFPPKIENAEETLRDTCYKNATEKYGDPLPEPIKSRLDKELDSIIGNGYAVMYISAKMLVDKSNSDGYLVGSRGSVGSSFAATMSGITEVNPLPPHYICPECKYLEWGDEKEYDCGVDMPEKTCPKCGAKLDQDGMTIPFETFLGFEGDKEPDIDLNFAGEYQARAHKYVENIFGSKNVYKAGTISTIASKTAYGFAMHYNELKGNSLNKYEVDRLTKSCTGVKKTTGQHPGGIVIVPEDHDIHEFCPVQHPANDASSDVITTHFDYHSIDQNLLKLDILGHDVPSIIKQLQDFTGMDPKKVPLTDKRVMSIFNGIDALDIKDPDYKASHGSYGIPEFGTDFVRQMLDDTQPEKFADLVRISGFSHGTNVWLNNARDFIKSGEATMREAISTRDDIMNYLILKGLPNRDAFNIMEKVRKGKGVKEEWQVEMRDHDVPEWYIESCNRISYMFPRAHAVAYVMMSFRIAYYKVYYPQAFYAAYLTTKMDSFKWDVIKQGKVVLQDEIDRCTKIGTRNLTQKEKDALIVYEVVREMYARGFDFAPPKFEYSKATKFTLKDEKVVVPICALENVGGVVGKSIEKCYKERPFDTIEDLQQRAQVNNAAIESLLKYGVLEGLPESNQVSFL